MNTAPIIARLQSQCPGLRFVGGALDLEESTLLSATYPAAFVIPLSESAEDNQFAGSHLQNLTQQWGVLLAVKAVRTTASDQSAELQTLRLQIRAALIGWTPSAERTEFNFTSGSLLGADAGMLLWQDEFTTTQIITGA